MFARPHGQASLHGLSAPANRTPSPAGRGASAGQYRQAGRGPAGGGMMTGLGTPNNPTHRFGSDGKAGLRRTFRPKACAGGTRHAPSRLRTVLRSPGGLARRDRPLCRTAERDNSWSDQSTPQVSVTTPKIPLTSQFPDHRIACGLVNSRATKCLGTVLDNKLGRFERLNRHPIVSGNSSPTELTMMLDMRSSANIESQNCGSSR